MNLLDGCKYKIYKLSYYKISVNSINSNFTICHQDQWYIRSFHDIVTYIEYNEVSSDTFLYSLYMYVDTGITRNKPFIAPGQVVLLPRNGECSQIDRGKYFVEIFVSTTVQRIVKLSNYIKTSVKRILLMLFKAS